MDDEHKPKDPPPVGRIKLLHQSIAGTGVCMYCGKPVDDWQRHDAPRTIDWVTTFPGPLEECPARKTS